MCEMFWGAGRSPLKTCLPIFVLVRLPRRIKAATIREPIGKQLLEEPPPWGAGVGAAVAPALAPGIVGLVGFGGNGVVAGIYPLSNSY